MLLIAKYASALSRDLTNEHLEDKINFILIILTINSKKI